MSVFNDERYVAQAVESILAQSFTDFEFLVMDDGSTDETGPILDRFTDPRLRVIRSEKNQGIAYQVNRGMSEARGKYIARMDGDDVALPDRLRLQVEFLEANPSVMICGGQVIRFSAEGREVLWDFPIESEKLLACLFFRGCFCNPATMFRTALVQELDFRYSDGWQLAEDYYFWYRVLKQFPGANLPQPILRYRVSKSQITQTNVAEKHDRLRHIRMAMLEDLGFYPNAIDISFHESVISDDWPEDEEFFDRAIAWLDKIYQFNLKSKVFPPQALGEEMSRHLFYRALTTGLRGVQPLKLRSKATFGQCWSPSKREVFSACLKPLKTLIR